ncbi:hypothetical protein FOH38_23855 [Lysinibacillus fusiformis]|nr:hypothetical protein FOH38_23855 [Lysinibacillus fusiformis]
MHILKVALIPSCGFLLYRNLVVTIISIGISAKVEGIEGDAHWFKLEYLDQLEANNMLHLHFRMDDNLSFDEGAKSQYLVNNTILNFHKSYSQV